MNVPNSSQRRAAMEINMTPMIDMVFLLIVYFVWNAGERNLESLLPSKLSEQIGTSAAVDTDTPPPPEADFDPVVVRVAATPQGITWHVNEQSLRSIEELRAVLQRLADIKRDAPLILHPDGNVPLGTVIDAYDLSRLIGFEKIQFATAGK